MCKDFVSPAMCRGLLSFCLLFSCLSVHAQCPQDNVMFVRSNAAAGGNGRSWSTAFNTLQAAINAGAACTTQKQIWVAAGTYYPTEKPWGLNSSDNRDLAFFLRNNQAIYGGFTGNETSLSERNPVNNQTILSGERGAAGNGDNCYHVVVNVYNNTTSLLDGFTITGGNANVNTDAAISIGANNYLLNRSNGGGMLNIGNAQPVLHNIIFADNAARIGAGMSNLNSAPKITAAVFTNNIASAWGGGMYNLASGAEIFSCLFTGNSADYGGGMNNEGGGPQVIGSTFYGNTATGNGSAIRNYGSAPVVSSAVIWANTGGSAVYSSNGSDTTLVNYSIIQGSTVYGGAGNKNTNPLFENTGNLRGADGLWRTADDGLRLTATSPGYNMGNNDVVTASVDITGAKRIQDGIIDAGAYEITEDPLRTRIYVDRSNNATPQDGKTWATAFNALDKAMMAADSGDSVWVAKGIYRQLVMGQFLQLKSGVKLYGGFAGNETSFAQRNITANNSIITGYFERAIKNTGVVDALLDGFSIVGRYGGVSNSNSSVTFRNVTFDQCGELAKGASLYNSDNSTITIINSVFSNSISTEGGAIYNENSRLEIRGSSFLNNTAKGFGSGGAIYTLNSNVQITKSKFINNQGFYGGGLYTQQDNQALWCRLDSVEFSGNRAKVFGGGVMTLGNLAADSVTFFNNRVDSVYPANITPEPMPGGGGLAIFGENVGANFLSTITLHRLLMTDNYSSYTGGAIGLIGFAGSTNTTLSNSMLFRNLAERRGGAILAVGRGAHADLYIKNTIIRENEARWLSQYGTAGGGLCLEGINPLIVNTVFERNIAGGGGGGINNDNSSPVIINCTLIRNVCNKAAASSNRGFNMATSPDSHPVMTNCIITGTTNNDQDEMFTVYPGSLRLTYSVTFPFLPPGMHPTSTANNPEPMADANSIGVYTPTSCNIVTDRGDASVLPPDITTDLYGNPRIVNGYVDIGAVENMAVPDTYLFRGDGKWDNRNNWECYWRPPSPLPIGKKIVINPVAGGKCELEQPYVIDKGAELKVMPGAVFEVKSGQ